MAIVTGGGSGIGAATACRLVALGARVAAVDSNLDAAEALASALGEEAITIGADVSIEDDIERYTQTTCERFGRVDLVHLNAGISGSFEPFPQVSTDQFDRVILRSVFIGLRIALRSFAVRPGSLACVKLRRDEAPVVSVFRAVFAG